MSALRSITATRPPAKRDEDYQMAFITKYGNSWHKGSPDNPISKEFRKLVASAGVNRRGLTFYATRHTFATVAGETGDQIAVNPIIGHVDDSMAARPMRPGDQRNPEIRASRVTNTGPLSVP